jgi:cell fate regulator YaaT (PSP1 superfamily)
MYKDSLKKIVNVMFRRDGKIYEFYTGNFVLNEGDSIIVETKKGMELGTVCSKPRLRDASVSKRPINKIFRLATQEDIEQKEKNERTEAEALKFCKEQIDNKELLMNLTGVELSFDRSKLVFFYTSQNRVDFRDLVKDLAQRFHTQVEMRQVGARDLAGMLGGVGHCGRRLCCSLFLSDFTPISIRMAKEQELSLNPSKISGICGRLMCCLGYEYDDYQKIKKERGNDERE